MRREGQLRWIRPAAARFTAVLSCLLALAAVGWADVIERMVAIVNGSVVIQNDVERYRDLKLAFGDSLPDESAALLGKLIEGMLISEQVDQFPGIQIADERIEAYMETLGDTRSLRPVTLHNAVRARLRRLRFTDLRFGQFIQPTDLEITDYYETVFVPEAKNQRLSSLPELDAVRDLIRTNVVAERINQEMSAWVESLLRRSEIEVVE
jgi:hypothetical protein